MERYTGVFTHDGKLYYFKKVEGRTLINDLKYSDGLFMNKEVSANIPTEIFQRLCNSGIYSIMKNPPLIQVLKSPRYDDEEVI